MMNLRSAFILLFIAASFSGCVKDKFEIEEINTNAEPVFGMPIGHARISAEKLIDRFDDEGIVQVGASGMLSVVYRDTLQSVSASDFFELDDQGVNQVFDLSASELAALNAVGSVTITTSQPFGFSSAEGDQLDSLRIRSGLAQLSLSSAGGFPVSGVVALRTGDGARTILSLPFEDLVPPVDFSASESMQNALLEFTNDGDSQSELIIHTEITFFASAGVIAAPLEIDFQLNEMEMQAVGGYLSPRSFPILSEGVNVTLFDDLPDGEFIIEEPRIHLYGQNGFGLGLTFDIDALSAIDKNGASLFVDGTQIERLPNISAATQTGSTQDWAASITNETINPSLTEIMAFKPNFLGGDFGLSLNPENAPSGFLTDTDVFTSFFELEIPVYGSIADYISTDTTTVSLGDLVSDIEDISEIESLDFRLFVNNGFPVDILAQFLFLDENDQVVDSLFDELSNIFLSAPLELSVPQDHPDFGRPVGATPVVMDVSMPRERIEQLSSVVSMVVQVRANTTSNGDHPIRLFVEDFFDVKLAAKTKVSFQ